jgi:CMP-N-acetylneuraminic acid synthetase
LKIVCVIPARGGSKRLPRKNIYPLFNKPLVCWSIDACLGSRYIDQKNIFVSTEDKEIKNIVEAKGISVIDRPSMLSKDSVWTQDVLSHAKNHLNKSGVYFDLMVRIQANSPQIESIKIDECIEKLIQNNLWEVFTVDQNGIEDSAIHVLLDRCVDQRALSVYKGVVSTNYIDVHTKDDIDKIIRKMENKNDN